MALFGVRVNGVPRFSGGSAQFPAGSTGAPGIAFTTSPKTGFTQVGNGGVVEVINGVNNVLITNQEIRSASPGWFSWSANADPTLASADLVIQRQAANTLQIFDGSTNNSTVLLGSVDFRQAASTFALTATLLNAPRATNPVAWIEVKVSGTTGRIPVW